MIGSVVLTGASGFLGWHVRVLARALAMPEPIIVGHADLADPDQLAAKLDGADRVLHLAGANRGEDDEVRLGNIEPAQALTEGLRRCATPPKTVAYANSIQAGNGSPYGDSKAAAAQTLADATRWSGSAFVNVRLPNLFGEHGRPYYNSVVATFCRALIDGGTLEIIHDRELDLLHASDAAAALLSDDPAGPLRRSSRRSVRQLAQRLGYFAASYRAAAIPELADRFDIRLFNTFRSHCFPQHYPLRIDRYADDRGELVEAVKAPGAAGQSFYSATRPGYSRGDHYHLAKVERFVVLRGEAEICLRRVLHDEVVRFLVSGAEPVAVDMPTMWAHRIINVGGDELLTLFWTNEVFDPAHPDTYPERVSP